RSQRLLSSLARILSECWSNILLPNPFSLAVTLISNLASPGGKPAAREVIGRGDRGCSVLGIGSTQHHAFVTRAQTQRRRLIVDSRGTDGLRGGFRQCRELGLGKFSRNRLGPHLGFGCGKQWCGRLLDLVELIDALLMPGFDGSLLRPCRVARNRVLDELRFEDVDLLFDSVADNVVKKLVGDVLFALGDVPRPPTVLLRHSLSRTVHEDLTL